MRDQSFSVLPTWKFSITVEPLGAVASQSRVITSDRVSPHLQIEVRDEDVDRHDDRPGLAIHRSAARGFLLRAQTARHAVVALRIVDAARSGLDDWVFCANRW